MKGKAHVFGDSVDTDAIIPARFCLEKTSQNLALHCFHDYRPDFRSSVAAGDIVVAMAEFGSGSSREMAVAALQGCGITAVIAESFASIFLRNAVNNGLQVFLAENLAGFCQDGDILELASDSLQLVNCSTGGIKSVRSAADGLAQAILEAGGLMAYISQKKIMKGVKNDCC